MPNPLCNRCNSETQGETTSFTVVKDDSVYVVRDVPCWECLSCGQVIYDQNVVKRLELFTSGRALPIHKVLTAWVYRWEDAITTVLTTSTPTSTERAAPLAVSGNKSW